MSDLDALFQKARRERHRYFGDKIFLYGFLYIGTYCRNNCNFCFYRSSNTNLERYRKDAESILDAARLLADSGVHLIDLTMGEDPQMFNDSTGGFEGLTHLVARVKEETGLPVMVSPGVVPERILSLLASAGADWFACYQETHNRELFGKLRPGQDFDERFNVKKLAHRHGMLTEEGILVGVGETDEDFSLTLEAVRELNVEQVRAMNFVPQAGTPMENLPAPDPSEELRRIAELRIHFPDKLIPATLDVEGLAGLKRRLDAGANVVTSIVPPRRGLAGVAQNKMDIDSARRTTGSVVSVLEESGLQAATVEEYGDWIRSRER